MSAKPEGSGIATAGELEQRLAQRAKPKATPALSPPGMDGLKALRQASNTNESRITYLRSRLTISTERLHVDHSKAEVAGKAKAGFERSR